MWFLIGLIVGVGGTLLIAWIRSKQFSIRWYEWLIGVVALLLALLAIQSYSASMAELEPRAAYFFLLLLGFPALLLAVVAGLLPYRRMQNEA